VAMTGGAQRAVVLTRPEYHLPAPGPTFAGRDVFAPVAAHLANGVPLDAVGEAIDPNLLLPGLLPLNKREGDSVTCEVLWVDRYGNAQLNVDLDDLEGFGNRVLLRVGETVRATVRATTYGEIPGGQAIPVWLIWAMPLFWTGMLVAAAAALARLKETSADFADYAD